MVHNGTAQMLNSQLQVLLMKDRRTDGLKLSPMRLRKMQERVGDCLALCLAVTYMYNMTQAFMYKRDMR